MYLKKCVSMDVNISHGNTLCGCGQPGLSSEDHLRAQGSGSDVNPAVPPLLTLALVI